MIAKTFGQDPREVARWEPDWLAAVVTVLGAEADAEKERAVRNERRAKRSRAGSR